MYIDANGDAEANYTVVALKKDITSILGRSMNQVGYFQPSEQGSGIPVSQTTVMHVYARPLLPLGISVLFIVKQ